MNRKVTIVEDEAIIAHNLELILIKAGYEVAGIADSVPDAIKLIERNRPDIVLIDIFLKGELTGIDLGRYLAGQHSAFIYLSANHDDSILERAKITEPYGFLTKPFREREVLAMIDVILYRRQSVSEVINREERLMEQLLIRLADSHDGWEERIISMAGGLQANIPFDCLSIHMQHEGIRQANSSILMRVGFDKYKFITPTDFQERTGLNANQVASINNNAIFDPGAFNEDVFLRQTQRCPLKKILAGIFQMKSCLVFSLVISSGRIVYFTFYNRNTTAYSLLHQKLLCLLLPHLVQLLESLTKAPATAKSGNAPAAMQTSRGTPAFNNIIGNSPLMLEVMDYITVVAPLDTSVLILGESGTGKERIAKSIHQLSPRKNGPFVVVNCASMPASLIESELFGHEKGAFTGAVDKRIGKFEVANKGTIFLDEIGEMTPELQVRLLRVLQEREIERIGSNELLKIDIRLISATNRDLEQEVKNGRFRLDLYYRLCVFPIVVPALRHRQGDILLLATYFMERFAARLNKKILGFSEGAKKQLQLYNWPGNVRELENSMERAVLLCTGNIIDHIPIFASKMRKCNQTANDLPVALNSIDDQNKNLILSALMACDGKVGGKGGAAEKLGMPATTLHSKMKRLGLRKDWA